jgi:putative addiction module component (TIGR02574 family)
MSKRGAQVLEDALALPPSERAEVVERLLASLDGPTDPRIDELWAREAEERLDAFERGEIAAAPAEDVFRALKKAKL